MEVVVAVVEVALRLGDANDRPRQVRVVQAHALGERPAHKAVHVGIVEPCVGPLGVDRHESVLPTTTCAMWSVPSRWRLPRLVTVRQDRLAVSAGRTDGDLPGQVRGQ